MRPGFQHVEDPGGKGQHILPPAGKVIFGHGVKSVRLTIEVLARQELLVPGRIHFPVETAVLFIPHLFLQEPVSDFGGSEVLLDIPACPRHAREIPDHPGLSHERLGGLPLSVRSRARS